MRLLIRRSIAKSPVWRAPAPTCWWWATPKFAAQAIRKVHELDWKPLFFLSNASASVGAVIKPAGPEKRRRHNYRGVCEGSHRSQLGKRSGFERVA